MALILCEISDAAALWAAARLQERGVAVDLVFAPTLGAATRWEHRVDIRSATIDITLPDGRRLSSRHAEPILNRLSFVPVERLRMIGGGDFGYAVQEYFAFYLSWLHAWPGTVFNRPTPQGLSGNYRHPSAWASLGAQAGLPVRAWEQDEADPPDTAWLTSTAEVTAFVVADAVVLPPALPEAFTDGCRALAALADNAILGIDFARVADGDEWQVVGASPMPNLMLGGDPLLGALAAALGA